MPTGVRGSALDPQSRVYACVRAIIGAVVRQTGVPTRWNGELYEELDPDALASVDADGAMSLSRLAVIEAIELAYAPVRLSDADIEAVRDAVASVIHEAAHLSTRDGDASRAGAHPPADAAGEALDEGLTEIWTAENLDAIVQDIGLDELVPGVLDAPTNDAYPTYTASVHALLERLARAYGRSVETLEEHIRTTELSQRWNAIADIAIDRDLAGLMPDDDRPIIRESLANGLRESFMRAQSIEKRNDLDDASKSEQGVHVGQQAVRDLKVEVGRLRDGYRNRQRLMARPTSRQSSSEPASRSDRPVQGRMDPEIGRLQRLMGGGAPAAEATRMDPGQATRVSYRVAGAGRVAGRGRS